MSQKYRSPIVLGSSRTKMVGDALEQAGGLFQSRYLSPLRGRGAAASLHARKRSHSACRRAKKIDPDPANLDLRFPGGESKREQLTRIRKYLGEFIHNNPNYRRIGVSTHGGVLRRFIYSAMFCKRAIEGALFLRGYS